MGMGRAARAALAFSLMVAVMGVETLPGATVLMRTPLAAQEADTRRAQRARAYFVVT